MKRNSRAAQRTGRPGERIGLFSGRPILVLGDIMVDRYFWGRVRRISPEAPVPVVEVERETRRLGGAANVAHNILALGGSPLLCGIVGDDDDGRWMADEMERLGMDRSGVFLSRALPTTVKSRIVAHSQQVVRFDREIKSPPPREMAEAMTAFLRENWMAADGAVVSDYAKGVISEDLMDLLRSLLRRRKIPVAVDPKSPSFHIYRRVAVITPNSAEAAAAASLLGENSGDIDRIGSRLLASTGAGAILITRGEEGMALFEKGVKPRHLPTVAREVYDVTGAGDAVIGALALAMASGAGLDEAASIANAAAGVVVGEFGTVPATARQVRARLRERPPVRGSRGKGER